MSKAEQVILYVVSKLEGRVKIGRTRLMKLLYLIDLVAKHKLGRTVTGARYYYYLFGPFSDEVQQAVIDLTRQGLLEDDPELTHMGQAHNYRTAENVDVNGVCEDISVEERELIDEVVKKIGRRSLDYVVRTAYQTRPMKTAQPNSLLLADD